MSKPWRWRDHIEIHPAAHLFPKMSVSELRKLGEDIKRRGMTVPIDILHRADGKFVLLDGCNRLDALELVGCDLAALLKAATTGRPEKQLQIRYIAEPSDNISMVAVEDDIDPFDHVISTNVLRRHLTTAQKSEVIEKVLKMKPQASDRAIASLTKTDHKTVAAKRKKLEQTGEIPQPEKRLGSDGTARPARNNARSKPSKSVVARQPKPAPAQPPSDQIEMFPAPPRPTTASQAVVQHQRDRLTGESENPVSIRIPTHPKKAAAVLIKKFPRQQLIDLVAELNLLLVRTQVDVAPRSHSGGK